MPIIAVRMAASNLIIGQSGGCTAVINCTLAGVIEEAARQPAVGRVLGMRHGIEGLLSGELVDLGRETPETVAALRTTPSAALGSCRFKPNDHQLTQVLAILREHNVRYFLYVGGNDSADTSARLAALADHAGQDLVVVGLPKTIDNDLPEMDHCPGYGSAARFLAIATREAGLDTEAMRHVDPVKLIEVMGRDAGWLAAACALATRDEADAPQLVYVPEIGLEPDLFLADVQRVYERLGYVVAVVPERIARPGGQPLGSGEPTFVDAFGHAYFESPVVYLAREVQRAFGLRARFDKPGTLQRMSIPLASSTDQEEAYVLGQAGVRQAVKGATGQMVTLLREPGPGYACRTGLAPLGAVANGVRTLPRDFLDAAGTFISPAFRSYALPLVGAPLPEYARLAQHPA
ncbi:MAG TPA: 6-phosphofructokinase [Chloroflexota bacterium]|nr:6-phosphofructokinase [Chloroflexota bacterium]